MIEIFEKRGSWCYRNADGKLLKFATEAEAKLSLVLREEIDNGSEAEKDKEEGSAEEKSAPSFGIGKKDTSSKGKKN